MLAGSGAAAVAAEHLTLEAAQRLALQSQPLLEAQTALIVARRERAVSARQLPDPKLQTGVSELPANTADAWSLSRDGDTDLMVGFMQEFPRTYLVRLEVPYRCPKLRRSDKRLFARHIFPESVQSIIGATDALRSMIPLRFSTKTPSFPVVFIRAIFAVFLRIRWSLPVARPQRSHGIGTEKSQEKTPAMRVHVQWSPSSAAASASQERRYAK